MTTSGDSFQPELKSWLWSVAFGGRDGGKTPITRLRGGKRGQENNQRDQTARVHLLLLAFFVTGASVEAGTFIWTLQFELMAAEIA